MSHTRLSAPAAGKREHPDAEQDRRNAGEPQPELAAHLARGAGGGQITGTRPVTIAQTAMRRRRISRGEVREGEAR